MDKLYLSENFGRMTGGELPQKNQSRGSESKQVGPPTFRVSP